MEDSRGEEPATVAMRRSGVSSSTSITVFTDGAANLRAMHRRIASDAENVLDWFHAGIRFEQLKQVAKSNNGLNNGSLRAHGRDRAREMAVLERLHGTRHHWSRLPWRVDSREVFRAHAIHEKAGQGAVRCASISGVGFGLHAALRIQVLNGTFEDAFRHWHQGFCPIKDRTQGIMAA